MIYIGDNLNKNDPHIGDKIHRKYKLNEDGANLEYTSEVDAFLNHIKIFVNTLSKLLVLESLLKFVVNHIANNGLVISLLVPNILN